MPFLTLFWLLFHFPIIISAIELFAHLVFVTKSKFAFFLLRFVLPPEIDSSVACSVLIREPNTG